MRVALDLDGVCYNWSDTARFLLNHEFGLELGESTYWDYIKDNISPDQWWWLWNTGIERGLYRYGHLFKGTKEAVDEMVRHHEVVLVTSRPRSAVHDTLDWLAYHRFATQEVHIVGQDKPKSAIGVDVYIDDALHVLEDVLENTRSRAILIDRPWNGMGAWRDPPGFPKTMDRWTRAFNWEDVHEFLADWPGEGV